jgi:hypothetical protein
LPSCSTLNVPVHKSLSLLVCIFRCPVAFTDYCYSFCHASVNFLSFFMGPAGPLLQGFLQVEMFQVTNPPYNRLMHRTEPGPSASIQDASTIQDTPTFHNCVLDDFLKCGGIF